MNKDKDIFFDSKSINLDLYYLSNSLSDLINRAHYPDYVNQKLIECLGLVDDLVYGPIPDGFDIADEKAILLTFFEKPNFCKESCNCGK